MSSSSSSGDIAFMLLTGHTAPRPHIVALFRFGDNDGRVSGSYEYLLGDGRREEVFARGHLTWDPGYDAGRAPFFSVAPVRLDLRKEGVKWSVGTSDFITCPLPGPLRIEKIQISATAADGPPGRVVMWDWIDVVLHYEGGQHETHASPCLPKVSTTIPTRRAAAAHSAGALPLQQYVEIGVHADEVSGLQMRGQVTLRAPHDSRPLGPDDLQGKVLVYLQE